MLQTGDEGHVDAGPRMPGLNVGGTQMMEEDEQWRKNVLILPVIGHQHKHSQLCVFVPACLLIRRFSLWCTCACDCMFARA